MHELLVVMQVETVEIDALAAVNLFDPQKSGREEVRWLCRYRAA